MKGGNKFLIWAKAYSSQKQNELVYCWISGISIGLCIVGVILAKILKFEMSYIPLPVLITAFLIVLLFKDSFYSQKISTRLQLRYLLKQKETRGLDDSYKDFKDEEWKDDSESRNAEDYKDITAAIDQVQRLQTSS